MKLRYVFKERFRFFINSLKNSLLTLTGKKRHMLHTEVLNVNMLFEEQHIL